MKHVNDIRGLLQSFDMFNDPVIMHREAIKSESVAAKFKYGSIGIVTGFPRMTALTLKGETSAKNVGSSMDPPMRIHHGVPERAT